MVHHVARKVIISVNSLKEKEKLEVLLLSKGFNLRESDFDDESYLGFTLDLIDKEVCSVHYGPQNKNSSWYNEKDKYEDVTGHPDWQLNTLNTEGCLLKPINPIESLAEQIRQEAQSKLKQFGYTIK